MSEVLVVVDHVDGAIRKPTFELLALAKRLGEPAAVVFGGSDVASAAAEKLKSFGAEKIYVIDDAEMARVIGTFKNRWKDPDGAPTAVYIGCPHNTYDEILYWSKKIDKEIKESGQEKVAIPVVMACSIVVRNRLLDEHPILLRDVLRAGVRFTTICTPAYQGLKGMADIDRGVTNSNKARFYSRLRLFGDDDLLQIAMTGTLPA